MRMKIAVDAMGGDFAPEELVLGAVRFLETDAETGLILVGNESLIRSTMPKLPERCEIYHTEEFVDMGELPMQALRRKKEASIAVAARLVREKKAEALLSAGSTGAQMVASLMELGRIPGVDRPAISVMLPGAGEHGVLLLDVGANVDCKPHHILQFAFMGSTYYQKVCQTECPAVGLLNIGEEDSKGNELTKAAYRLMKSSSLNFVGNVEADQLYYGKAHVVVCDGFAGNVLLKVSESISEIIQGAVFKTLQSLELPAQKLGEIKSGLKKFSSDAPEYSAAPLLGINGVSVVCHGKSKAPVIANALTLAKSYASTGVIDMIQTRVKNEGAGERDNDGTTGKRR